MRFVLLTKNHSLKKSVKQSPQKAVCKRTSIKQGKHHRALRERSQVSIESAWRILDRIRLQERKLNDKKIIMDF